MNKIIIVSIVTLLTVFGVLAKADESVVLVTPQLQCQLANSQMRDYGVQVDIYNQVLSNGVNQLKARVAESTMTGRHMPFFFDIQGIPPMPRQLGGAYTYQATQPALQGEFNMSVNYTVAPLPGAFPIRAILKAKPAKAGVIQAELGCRNVRPVEQSILECKPARLIPDLSKYITITARTFTGGAPGASHAPIFVGAIQTTGLSMMQQFHTEFPVQYMIQPLDRRLYKITEYAFAQNRKLFDLQINPMMRSQDAQYPLVGRLFENSNVAQDMLCRGSLAPFGSNQN